jgi:transcriptional regulator
MYLPAHFEETRIEVLHQLVRSHPLGMLVTLGAGGLNANHIPFELHPDPAPFGTLRAHVARANPAWQELQGGVEPLVVFQGPHHYITPSWYPAKRVGGKVVPTFNYLVAHAYGPARAIDDPAWLRTLVGRLTDRFEAGREVPWKVDDAPADFVAAQLRASVGIEMPVARLIGKWKASQNRPDADRIGVVEGLRQAAGAHAEAMAAAVQEQMANQGRE